MIRCTKKLRKEMGLNRDDLENNDGNEIKLGGWHANLIYINRRKCILFANDKTLLNFLVPGLTRKQIRQLDNEFRNHLEKLLANEGLKKELQLQIIGEYRHVEYGKTNSRSILGSMNDLADNYTYHILDRGGVQHADMNNIVKAMNRMPMGAISYHSPIKVFLEMYNIDDSPFKLC